ncbi:hypothetical protein [Actinoallomurus sp. CA-142502]|uniref:hypothetical protein n=1 Tax=Actinoallomurus sp. CA-142502 TaxID=3239885 RepID=UPI003D8D31D4
MPAAGDLLRVRGVAVKEGENACLTVTLVPHADDAEPSYLLAAPIGDIAPVLVPADLWRHRRRITMKMFYPVSLHFGIDLRAGRIPKVGCRVC